MQRVFRVVLDDSGSRYMTEIMNKLEQQYGAEEVGTAEWIEDTLTKFKVVCSKCGARNFGADRAYCPRCGRRTAMVDLTKRIGNRGKLVYTENGYEPRIEQVITVDALRDWLSSFDTNSATECFTAVNLLKERLRNE